MPDATETVKIVTGYTGEPHVTAAQEGRRNAGTFGGGRYVLDTGQQLAITVESANAVTVGTGDGIMDGRHVTVEVGTTLAVDSGTQGVKRNDLVCMRYQVDLDTNVESVSLVVIKGTPTSGEPADPACNDGASILEGATVVDWPLWRLPLAGVTVGTPVQLFERLDTIAALSDLLATHTHDARGITSGQLAIARGGTGRSTAEANQVFAAPNGSEGAPSFRQLEPADIPSLPASKVGNGIFPVARGGTGLAASPSMRVNLGSTGTDSVMKASPRPGIEGTLAVGHGGTGATSAKDARKNLGVGYKPNDTLSGTIQTAGYVTNGGKQFYFCIPATRICDGTPTLTKCLLRVRQGGYYIVGSADSASNVVSKAKVRLTPHGYQVEITLTSANSHTTNNDCCGITCEYTIKVA